MNRYTASQLTQALKRIKVIDFRGQVTRVDISQALNGASVVKLIEQRRDSTFDFELALTLTA